MFRIKKKVCLRKKSASIIVKKACFLVTDRKFILDLMRKKVWPDEKTTPPPPPLVGPSGFFFTQREMGRPGGNSEFPCPHPSVGYFPDILTRFKG